MIQAALTPWALALNGVFQADAKDDLPPGTRSVILLGPDGPAFWTLFTDSPEYGDGNPDPLNRWSERAIGAIARDLGGTPIFPFGGPPYYPFLDWAVRTGRAWQSPVQLLVHDQSGLFVSYRGAVALPYVVDDPTPPQDRPCDTCAGQPCLTACPVAALSADGYDVPRCHAHLDTPEGRDCLDGCLVRRACPIGQDLRPLAQSAFHMAAFHPGTS